MADSSFLTGRARVLLCIADPRVRLRDIAARTGVTERSAYGIVTDLTKPGTSSSTRTAAATGGFGHESASQRVPLIAAEAVRMGGPASVAVSWIVAAISNSEPAGQRTIEMIEARSWPKSGQAGS
jgi:hypothetical protein